MDRLCYRRSHSLRRPTGWNRHRSSRLGVEPLELRNLLSAVSLLDSLFAEPTVELLAGVTNTAPQGFTPAQIKQAYGFNGIVFGGSVHGDGAGQTIAIVDAYSDPNIASDLHVFDATFGLADPPKFTVVNQNGGTSLPRADAGWAQEIALDVEWAHAMAPGASILLVEASSSSISDLMTAVNTARNAAGVSVVSMSWGSGEFSSERQYDSYFTTPAGHTGVTFTASAGDGGAQALWPAISTNVLSVGGTSLSASNGYSGESAWSGSGGGYSRYEAEPSFQRGVQTSGARSSPDVSYDANPNTGFAVYDSLSTGGRSGWFQIGGTSAGTPQWAALLAIANQGRVLSGQGTLSNGQSSIYNLPASDFHDATTGSNGYAAKAGYDLVTGRGSPIASAVIADLVGNASVSTSSGQSTSTSSGSSTSTTTTTTHSRYELIYWNHRWWLVPVGFMAIDSGQANPEEVDSVESATAESSTSSPNQTTLPAAMAVAVADTHDAAAPGASVSVMAMLGSPSLACGAAGDVEVASIAQSSGDYSSGDAAPQAPTSEPSTERSLRSIDAVVPSLELAAATPQPAGDTSLSLEFSSLEAPAVQSTGDLCFGDRQWLGEIVSEVQAELVARTPLFDTALGLVALGCVLADRQRRDNHPRIRPRSTMRT